MIRLSPTCKQESSRSLILFTSAIMRRMLPLLSQCSLTRLQRESPLSTVTVFVAQISSAEITVIPVIIASVHIKPISPVKILRLLIILARLLFLAILIFLTSFVISNHSFQYVNLSKNLFVEYLFVVSKFILPEKCMFVNSFFRKFVCFFYLSVILLFIRLSIPFYILIFLLCSHSPSYMAFRFILLQYCFCLLIK